jgi:hypothetical protein
MVLAWVSERLAVAINGSRVAIKPLVIDLEARWGDKGQAGKPCRLRD